MELDQEGNEAPKKPKLKPKRKVRAKTEAAIHTPAPVPERGDRETTLVPITPEALVSPNPFHRAKLAIAGSPTPLGPRRKPGGVGAKKSRMVELTHRLLNSKGQRVIEKIIEVALDDKHPGQMQALKLCVERIAPVSVFEDIHGKSANNTIEIKVSITDPRAPVTIEAEDAEVVNE